jgi:hypothetical protein
MRLSVIRALAACVLLGFVSGAVSHDLIQKPTWRVRLYGSITEPNHVANGTVQFPVCTNKSSAAAIHFAAGYIFMRALTHIAKGEPRLGHWLRERSSSFGATCPVAIGGFV